MPVVRKLSETEVHTIERRPGKRKQVALAYDDMLGDFEVGDYGELTLTDDENRLTVRNRLKAAADRRGVEVRLLRRRNGPHTIVFQLVPPGQE